MNSTIRLNSAKMDSSTCSATSLKSETSIEPSYVSCLILSLSGLCKISAAGKTGVNETTFPTTDTIRKDLGRSKKVGSR